MKRVLGCLLVLLLAAPVLAALDVARLEEIATREVIPEVQMAAGLALVDYYTANKTEAELMDLVANGATEAIRTAAEMALSRLWIGAGKSFEELIDIVYNRDESSLLRLAAVDALLEYLIEKEDSTLETIYREGPTPEARYAGAKAYFHKNRGKFDRESLEAICQDDQYTDGYRKAAAELLAGHYLFPPANAKTQAELEDQAQLGASEYLRYAASLALSTLLIKSDITKEELLKKLVSFYLNPGPLSEEYKYAYVRALAARWAAGL
ncbi:TPA: hypothetical protein EYP84_02330 [Candidatus Bipolaricaulota bacterium]|nr:hypothetical protein [Candidatus Bipolaricaulota bacterium]